MKETGITLSIIIPVYNVMAYLRPCLDGLLSQTCPAGFSYEVLLADDGSTDGSGAVCDEYAAAYRQVRALHRENGGQSAARNQAIRAAEGAWLAFVDSDDLVRPEFLAALAGVATGLAMVFGVDETTISTVAGAVTTVASVVSYIMSEGMVDAAAVGAGKDK